MNPSRFDMISRLFAERRLSRRQAMQGAGVLAAGTLATAGLAHADTQESTPMAPVASPEAKVGDASFLFVQTFGAGSLAPKTGEAGILTLTADHLAGQTVYFSDRPERIAGMVATERFLGTGSSQGPSSDIGTATPESGLGFTPANPPNAALVFASEGDTADPGDVVVVELIDPTYDPASGKATYDVRVLADESAVDLTLVAEPVAEADAIRQFGAASLFIDDCPNGSVVCIFPPYFNPNDPTPPPTQEGLYVDIGFCYDALAVCCWPCNGPSSVAYEGICNSTFQECQNNCTVSIQETWACNF